MPTVAQVEALKREVEGLRQELATTKGRVQQLRKANKTEASLPELKKQAATISEEIDRLGGAYDDLIERYQELIRKVEKSQSSPASTQPEPEDLEA
jgi:chromosome segregation ATPase